VSNETLHRNQRLIRALRQLADWIDANASTIPAGTSARLFIQADSPEGVAAYARQHLLAEPHTAPDGTVSAETVFPPLTCTVYATAAKDAK